VAVPVPPGTRGDAGEFHHNRRRALLISAVPGFAVFVVVAVVGVAIELDVIGLVAGVGAGLLVWLMLWRGATRFVLRALGARPGGEEELARAENLVDGLCATMGVEPPDILVIDEWARQALALGRKSARRCSWDVGPVAIGSTRCVSRACSPRARAREAR